MINKGRVKKKLTRMFKEYRRVLFRGSDSILYEEAMELYDNGQAVIIDVRDEEEYEQWHIGSAINIPVYDISRKISDVVFNKSKIIVVYCKTGKRSKMAKKILEEQGYNNVYILYL